jgi:hypothetical protein
MLVLVPSGAPIGPQGSPDALGGTSWQLVRFQGGDGTMLTPDEKTKYTVAFASAAPELPPARISFGSARRRSPARCVRPDRSTTTS